MTRTLSKLACIGLICTAVAASTATAVEGATTSDAGIARAAKTGNAAMATAQKKMLAAMKTMNRDEVAGVFALQQAATDAEIAMQLARIRIQAQAPSSSRARTAKTLLVQAFAAWKTWASMNYQWAEDRLNDYPDYTLSTRASAKWRLGSKLYWEGMRHLTS